METIRLALLFTLSTLFAACSNDDELPPLADFLYQTTWETEAESSYETRFFFLNREKGIESPLSYQDNGTYFKYQIEGNVISITYHDIPRDHWLIEERTKNTMKWVSYEKSKVCTLYLKKVSP